MLDMLKAEARRAVKLLEKHEFVRIYTHYDPDGISAGAIMATALLRLGKRFQLRFLRGLNDPVEYESDELVILEDMGSGYPDVVSEIDADVIIVDHHYPVGRIEPKKELVHVNPHLAGLDGTFELSASGTAYVVANVLGDNRDLIGLAIVGMLGDKQKLVGGNAEIVREGVEGGYVELKRGINLHSGKVREVLMLSVEPYLDFYGKEEELDEFLAKAKVDGDKDVDELSEEETHRLADAIVLKLMKQGAYVGVIEEFIGRKFVLKNELVKNAVTLTDIVNACGRLSACSIGFAVCMRDEGYLEKAMEIWRKYRIDLLEELRRRKEEVKEGECIRFIVMENAPATGPVATVFSRYLYADKPFIAVNVKNGRAKVSARSNDGIGVDLAEVMRKAAEKVGGRGGGHRVAAGANIDPDKVDEFIKEVDRLCCVQLGG